MKSMQGHTWIIGQYLCVCVCARVCVYVLYTAGTLTVYENISLLLLMVLAVWKWVAASVVGGSVNNMSLQLGNDDFQKHLI